MRISAMTMVATLLAITAYAGEGADSYAKSKVSVCIQGAVFPEIGVRARWLASRMFSAIGVTLDWRGGFSRCPSGAIMVSFTDNTPTDLQPGALAYALPYEGTHIRVFYDRITETCDRALVPSLLGHVLAHEITHVLEGVGWHSNYGVMKARWDIKDYSKMRVKPLEFTDEDIHMIYLGLAARNARATMAGNAKAEPLARR